MTEAAAPPDAAGLEHALAALGAAGTVEARGRLAVLTTADGASLAASPELARRAVELAASYGFVSLAVELARRDSPVRRP